MVSSYPPPPTGIATYTSKLSLALADCGVKVTVLSNKGLSRMGAVTVFKAWDESDATYFLKLFKRIACTGFDIVHIQHEYWLYGRGVRSIAFLLLLLLLRLLSKTIVITMHEVIRPEGLRKEFFQNHRLGKRMVFIKRTYIKLYNKLVCILAARVIVHSCMAKAILVNGYNVNPAKVVIIHHGVDQVECGPREGEVMGKPDLKNNFEILIFGHIRREKGIEYAISAMPEILSEIHSCILTVAGLYDDEISPESKGYLDELIVLAGKLKLGDHVRFRTNVCEDEAKNLFQEADVVVFPYVEDNIIATSGPVLMALSFGKPIIATGLRRFKGYLKDGENALIIPPANSSSLAKAVISVLNDNELRSKLSRNSRKSADSLSWGEAAKKTLSLYNKLLRKLP
jgi:glycosyltransferase involved in cell wall biosynthesis